jgi:hypothetical protein
LVIHFGKPDLFVTFTANPTWEEVVGALFERQSTANRPNIIARVFRAKLKDLIKLIKSNKAFGKIRALIYTIKYQKRGLPHAHILIFLDSGHAFSEPELIDNLILAELPDQRLDPDRSLTAIVKQMIVHGLCGPLKPGAACMRKTNPNAPLTYSKRFPKLFTKETTVGSNGYPEYRRRHVVNGVEVR